MKIAVNTADMRGRTTPRVLSVLARHRLSMGLLAGTLIAIPSAHAQSIDWIAESGVWSNPLNWQGANVPDNVFEFPVLGGQSPYRVGLDFGYAFGTLTISNSLATLDIYEDRQPVIHGDLINQGAIVVNPKGIGTYTSLGFHLDSIITGTGIIRLNDATITSPFVEERLLTNGQGHTIVGSGHIVGPVNNRGTIVADGPAGSEMTFGHNGFGESLVIAQSDTGLIYAKTGNIRFPRWIDATVEGGVLRADQPAQIVIDDFADLHLRDVHLQADIELAQRNQTLTLEGNIVNDSTIMIINDRSSRPVIKFLSDTTVSGNGQIALGQGVEPDDDPSEMFIEPNSIFINGPGHTIRGQGTITVADTSTFINEGTIIADHDRGGLTLVGNFEGAGIYDSSRRRIYFKPGADGVAHFKGGTLKPIVGGAQRSSVIFYPGYTITDIINEGDTDFLGSSLGGTIVNSGTLSFLGGTTTHDDFVFSGTGTALFSANLALVPASGHSITNMSEHSFEIYGTVSGPLINHGTITGHGTIQGPFTNHGIIRSSEFGILTLTGDHIEGGGDFNAGTHGLSLSECTITDATLDTDSDSMIFLYNANLQSITNNAYLRSYRPSISIISGTFVNNHTLSLSGLNATTVQFANTMTVEGEGVIEMIGVRVNTPSRLVANPGQIVTLNPLQRLVGHGKSLGSFIVEGDIEIESPSNLNIPAILSVDDLTLTDSSSLSIELDSFLALQDRVRVLSDGTIHLAGTLSINFTTPTAPEFGQWTIIETQDNATIVGEFHTINLPQAPDNKRWHIEQTAGELTLALTCSSDLNGDFAFNFLDVSAFLEAFSQQSLESDFNHDGVLSFYDISAFIEAFNSPCE